MYHAKIIPLVPAYPTQKQQDIPVNKLARSAWNFARTLLWPEKNFSHEDICATLTHIQGYFEEATAKKKAFLVFCERVILTQKYIAGQQSRFVPNPYVWFNRNYQHGFAGTKAWYQQVQCKREEVPGYLQHISIAAEHYYAYTQKPSAKTLYACRKKLLDLNASCMLQYFYNAIIHFTHSTCHK